jgi:hypothetical protein
MSNRRATKRRRVTTDVEQSAKSEPVVEAGNAEPGRVTEDGYAVFCWPGPGTYNGSASGGRALPRHAAVSLPAYQFKQALADGLTFIRWAAGSGE